MKRRWRLWLALFLALLAGASLLHPAVHWRLLGWARGEAFYQGFPTSWWVADIEDHFIPLLNWNPDGPGSPVYTPDLLSPKDWVRGKPNPWYEWRPSWWGGSNDRTVDLLDFDFAPLVNGDPAALPVLLELIRRPEVKSRQVGVTGLFGLARREPAAGAALRAAAADPDPDVSQQAQQGLERLRMPR